MEIRDLPEAWPVVETEDLHRDGWVIALRSDQVYRPGDDSATPFRRIVLEHPGAAVVLAIDSEARVLCLKQYRHPAQHKLIELPAGLCDVPGEEPLVVARRELREEAAFEAAHWQHLGSTYSSPGISTERVHMFLATGLTQTDRGDFELRHEEADMEVLWVPFRELLEAVLSGRVIDGPVVQAVALAQLRGLLDT